MSLKEAYFVFVKRFESTNRLKLTSYQLILGYWTDELVKQVVLTRLA